VLSSYKLKWTAWLQTKQPDVLRELFEALGNDPLVIAECLARPALAERLLSHSTVEQLKQTSQTNSRIVVGAGNYSLPAISDLPGGCIVDTWTPTSTTNAPTARHFHTAVWTGSEMIILGRGKIRHPIFLTPAGNTTLARTVGQLPTPPTRRLREPLTPRFGLAAK
jgi:hypothetical protein